MTDTRVIAVNGARQAGKSTLARLAAAARPGSVVRLLDDPATLRSARDDPAGFVDHDGLVRLVRHAVCRAISARARFGWG